MEAQKLRMEQERKRRLEMEAKFTCKVEETTDSVVDELMDGKDVYLKGTRVSYGMMNRGNTCFFNTVMQVLIHTVPLHQMIVGDSNLTGFCRQKDNVLSAFIKFVQKLRAEKRAPLEVMCSKIKKVLPAYQRGVQEDAQEYILGIFDHFIKACFDHPNPV